MLERQRRPQATSNYKSNQFSYIRKRQTQYHQGSFKKGQITVIETILDDSNKENEAKTINSQLKEAHSVKDTDVSPPSSVIEVSNECLKKAFYFPKKLANVYKKYALVPNVKEVNETSMQQQLLIGGREGNELESKDKMTVSLTKEQQYFQFRQQLQLMLQQQQYNAMSMMMIMPLQQQQQLKALEIINQEQLRMKENTEILSINIKLGEDQYALCKIRRFDDLFLTIKVFCEINQIDSSFIRPLITEVFFALNSIYSSMNSYLSDKNIGYLDSIRSMIKVLCPG